MVQSSVRMHIFSSEAIIVLLPAAAELGSDRKGQLGLSRSFLLPSVAAQNNMSMQQRRRWCELTRSSLI